MTVSSHLKQLNLSLCVFLSAAVYLCKRTMQNKARLELADYEAVSVSLVFVLFGLMKISGFMNWSVCDEVGRKAQIVLVRVFSAGEFGETTESFCTEMGVYIYASRSASEVSDQISDQTLESVSVWVCDSSHDFLSPVRVDKKRDKIERKILDSQERAFWDVHRPVVSLNPSTGNKQTNTLTFHLKHEFCLFSLCAEKWRSWGCN